MEKIVAGYQKSEEELISAITSDGNPETEAEEKWTWQGKTTAVQRKKSEQNLEQRVDW